MKTSLTHPLRIDTVTTPVGGRIGLTFCPGKRQPDALTGPWDRDLDLDLDAIKGWGAAALITLMEQHELDRVKVAEIGTKAEALGLEWHHLPIRDVDVPEAGFEAAWTYSGQRLRALLRGSKDIVVHCRGGLGRAGTIGARLLVELGMEPNAAVAAVRAARPGTIETEPQRQHVLAITPPALDSAVADRVLGCLYGGAVGDAFGYAVEFDKLSSIRGRFGPEGMTEPVYQGGRLIVSDDTQMTLFTAEGLVRAIRQGTADATTVTEEIRRAYLDWLATQGRGPGSHDPAGTLFGHKSLHHPRAPGNTCLSALRAGGCGTPAEPINDSKGCGGVMRTAPIGLIPALTPAQAFDLGNRAAALTHGHVDGWLCAGALSMMVRLLLDGADLRNAAEQALAATVATVPDSGTARLTRKALDLAERGDRNIIAGRLLGEGWVGDEALAIGLYAALVGKDFPDVLALSANHDGDSDSTASIAGQLYGAWRGLGELPHGWVRRLDILKPLARTATDIIDLTAGSQSSGHAR